MTQEQKDLLLKDLSARLSYGVICNTSKGDGHLCSINQTIFGIEYGINIKATERDYFNDREEITKPYLFPLSSMTDEQKKEEYEICKYYLTLYEPKLIAFYHKNHFDYRGLIEKGLAIDCTNLNIY